MSIWRSRMGSDFADRRMLLVLPDEHAFAAVQRAPWFKPDAQPEGWLHDGSTPRLQTMPTQGMRPAS